MKNIFKSLLIILVAFGITSCEDSDLQIDQLYDNVDTSGAVLRILDYPADLVNLTGGEVVPNTIDFLFEVQEGDGSYTPDFKEVRVYLSAYDDQDLVHPTIDVDGNEIGEFLYKTIDASEFAELSAVNGLPEANYNTETRSLLDDTFSTAVFGAANPIIVNRFELEMTDGRVWTDSNAGATLSGPYFESPFLTRTIFKVNEGIQTKMKVDEEEPEVGEELKFTLEVKNVGDDELGFTVTNVTLNAGLLPEGLTYDSDDGGGAYNPDTGIWTIGDIAPGDTEKLKLYAIVDNVDVGSNITYTIEEAIGDQRNPVVDHTKLTVTMIVQE